MEQNETQVSDRSQVAAGVLAIFLGGIGIHRFYLGKPGTAILMMLGTFLGFILLMIGGLGALVGVGQAIEGDVAAADESAAAAGGILIFAWVVLGTIGLWILVDIVRIFSGKVRDRQGRLVTSASGR